MDISTNSVHVAAPELGPGTWDDWDGPSYYLHMCSLNGWSCPNVSAVKVSCIFSNANDPTYCSTMACSLAVSVMEEGWELNGDGRLQIPPSMGCQHLIKKKMFEYLLVNLLNSYKSYSILRGQPPSQWSSWGDVIFDAIPQAQADNYKDMRREDDVETIRLLRYAIERCDDCQISLRDCNPPTDNFQSRFLYGRDRSAGHPESDCMDEIDPNGETVEAPQKYSLRGPQQRNVSRFLPRLGRFSRPKLPPTLPAPKHPLFPPHQPTFDDYQSGPTRDAFWPDQYGVSPFSIVNERHGHLFDHGYRLLSRFAHIFYLSPPAMVPDHIFPVGVASNYTPSSCMNRPLPSLSRAFGIGNETVEVDGIEMGAEEMLAAAGMEIGSKSSQNVFVRGRNPDDDKFIRFNLERDHIPQPRGSLQISSEIDSFIFVGQAIKVKEAVKLYVTVAVGRDPPIRNHNHVYVEILLPLTMEERMEYGPGQPSFLEKEFGLSQIPHMRFADLGEGVNVHVFFPRTIHNKPNSRFKDANISYLAQRLFLDRVTIPALHRHVPKTSMSRYGFDADGFNQKTATATYTTGNKGTPKGLSVPANVFNQMQGSMKDIIRDNLDGSLDQYGSFFFVLEAKGIGLGIVVDDMESNPPLLPFEKLKRHYSKLDWDFILNRANGESYFDIAFSVIPKSPVVGLWRLDALEASFGAGGYLSGKLFPLNTMGYYGSMQAETRVATKRHTHILHRSAYLFLYHISRNFENKPWSPSDAEAFHFTPQFQRVWKEHQTIYKKGISRQHGYGIRDEYRVGGQAVLEFLGAALEKVRCSCLAEMMLTL
jgi:hypothetical protein